MKTVYTASKGSYGDEFFGVTSTLENLKKAIFNHYHGYSDIPPISEEGIKEAIDNQNMTLYKVELHDDEEIVFNDYNGASNFDIVKKDHGILSTFTRIK